MKKLTDTETFNKYYSPGNSSSEERKRQHLEFLNSEEGKQNLINGYNCRACRNRGFIYKYDEEGNLVQKECSCSVIRTAYKRIVRSGLEEAIETLTFDNFKASEDWQKEIKQKAEQFCVDIPAKWFYIGGQSGSGKSHLCTAIASHYLWEGKDLRYMPWASESKRLKQIVNDISYREEIGKWKEAPVLYVDDFLKVEYGGNPTAADMRLAFELIDGRLYDRQKITIISSERTLKEHLSAGADEATIGRIYQAAGKYNLDVPRDRKKNYRFKSVG